MQNYQMWGFVLKATWVVFVMAFGACFGSLINVLAYRLPLGLGVVTGSSRCPKCDHRLAWYDNIPVLGWLMLRGKCRYCRKPISPEYPLVEAAVALIFGVVFVAFTMLPPDLVWLGVPWGQVRPVWSQLGPEHVWGIIAIDLFLIGCLAGMTVVDAKTFQIPLPLPWAATLVAVIAHPLWAVWLDSRYSIDLKSLYFLPDVRWWTPPPAWPWEWAIPTLGTADRRWLVALPFGGIAGLGLALLLLRFGLIRRSFEDYDDWERETLASRGVPAPVPSQDSPPSPSPDPDRDDPARAPAPDTPELWIQYPHARREVLKELVFLTPCLLGVVAAGFAAQAWFGARGPLPALWIQVLSGVCLGYLVGGGVVWTVRIFGSLAFGKEAMGLGDVHLMAAVGACLGWIDATVAFFIAAPIGLIWTLLAVVLGKGLSRTMPYGPYLALATLAVLLGKPLVQLGLNALIQTPPYAPIYIP
ncbi:MAG: prepilin peptidase [Planctomycetes bacterium]|nr:prepilin peptidase [Planctomycetota bacterium]